MPYTRLKSKCLDCNLHFIVFTWDRDKHSCTTLYCPECGRHNGRFFTWRDEDAGEISDEVPGLTAATPDFEAQQSRNVPLDQIIDNRDD